MWKWFEEGLKPKGVEIGKEFQLELSQKKRRNHRDGT